MNNNKQLSPDASHISWGQSMHAESPHGPEVTAIIAKLSLACRNLLNTERAGVTSNHGVTIWPQLMCGAVALCCQVLARYMHRGASFSSHQSQGVQHAVTYATAGGPVKISGAHVMPMPMPKLGAQAYKNPKYRAALHVSLPASSKVTWPIKGTERYKHGHQRRCCSAELLKQWSHASRRLVVVGLLVKYPSVLLVDHHRHAFWQCRSLLGRHQLAFKGRNELEQAGTVLERVPRARDGCNRPGQDDRVSGPELGSVVSRLVRKVFF